MDLESEGNLLGLTVDADVTNRALSTEKTTHRLPRTTHAMNCLHSDQIRDLVVATFQRYGLPTDYLLAETVLIRDGYYYGRSYRSGELIATYVAETAQLQIFARGTGLLDTLSCDEEQEVRRAAA